jgi:hypothetical protein
MTTDAETGNQIDAAAVWRAIGRLEGEITALKEGQSEIRAEIRDVRDGMHDGLREVNRRVDRLFYAILAVGGALFVAIFASRLIGG